MPYIKNREEVKRIRRSDCLQYEEFDKKYNVNTHHPIIPAADGSGEYKPGGILNSHKISGSSGLQNTPLEILDMINKEMSKVDNINDYTFIDIGSGKGRITLYQLLAKAPYKKYVGLEADKEWNDIAINNLKTTNIEIDKPAEFIEIDVRDYVAESSNCIYYFFYPFSPEVFDQFMSKNWDTISKTNSYVIFFVESEYNFKRYTKKDPIYDYCEITIYKVSD